MAKEMELIQPMSEFEKIVLEEINEEISNRYEIEGKIGKWILFFPNSLMNAAWEKSCQLYHAGKLPGIKSMKTSTAANNPTALIGNKAKGAIRFDCGPFDDEELMLEYGRALVDQLSYSDPFGSISYKTDERTDLGTRATGRRINHIYKIEVPKKCWLAGNENFIENDICEDIILPSTITTQSLLSEPTDKCDIEENSSGCWKMKIKESDMDEVWSTAVQLYRQKKLHGVHSILINTAMKTSRPNKVILFFCFPGNVKIIKMYGKNILKYMAEYNSRNLITYLVPNAPGYLTYQLQNWQGLGENVNVNTDFEELDSLAANFKESNVVNQ